MLVTSWAVAGALAKGWACEGRAAAGAAALTAGAVLAGLCTATNAYPAVNVTLRTSAQGNATQTYSVQFCRGANDWRDLADTANPTRLRTLSGTTQTKVLDGLGRVSSIVNSSGPTLALAPGTTR